MGCSFHSGLHTACSYFRSAHIVAKSAAEVGSLRPPPALSVTYTSRARASYCAPGVLPFFPPRLTAVRKPTTGRSEHPPWPHFRPHLLETGPPACPMANGTAPRRPVARPAVSGPQIGPYCVGPVFTLARSKIWVRCGIVVRPISGQVENPPLASIADPRQSPTPRRRSRPAPAGEWPHLANGWPTRPRPTAGA